MRILHVIGGLDPAQGGPPGAVVRMGAGQSVLGHQVRIASLDPADRMSAVQQAVARVPYRSSLDQVFLRRSGVHAGKAAGAEASRMVDLVRDADFLLLHEDRRGLEYYIAKHNRYSTLEAETLFFGESDHPAVRPKLFGNSIQRRRWFRTALYPNLPAKWVWRFIWMYFVRFGFLDGLNGLRFCLLIAAHELFTSLKLRELKLRAKTDRLAHASSDLHTTTRQLVEPPKVIAPAPAPQSAAFSPSPAWVATTHAASPASLPSSKEGSPWTMMENLKRALWIFASFLLFRFSFHNWYAWRRLVLRAFGAKIGPNVRIRPTARIEIPWNLEIGEGSVVGDFAILYCLGPVTIGRHAVISQYAHLCAGTHDYTTRRFPLIRMPITIGDEAWIAADAFVAPGITVGHRSVIGARSTVTKNVPPDQIWAGSPAKFMKDRILRES